MEQGELTKWEYSSYTINSIGSTYLHLVIESFRHYIYKRMSQLMDAEFFFGTKA